MRGLRALVLKGLGWRAGANLGQLVLQVVFTAILAPLLTKADFGLVAMAMLTIRLLASLTQVGLGMAILQARDVTPGLASAVFFVHAGLRTVVASLCALGAPLAAAFFGEPALDPVVRFLALSLVLQSLAFPQVLLHRELRFRGVAVVQLGALVVANAAGIFLAVTGHGVWALAWRALLQRALFAAGVWWLAGWRPARPDFRGVRKLLRFGFHVLGVNWSSYLSQNFVGILVGRLFGVELLGALNIAQNVAVAPAQRLYGALSSVLMPVLSRFQDDLAGMRRRLSETVFVFAAAVLPLMVGLACVSEPFVALAYGPRWKVVGPLVAVLAAVGLFRGLELVLRTALLARGASRAVMLATVAAMIASVPVMLGGAALFGFWGLLGGHVLASAFALGLYLGAGRGLLGYRAFWRATARSAAAAGLMGVAVVLVGATVSGGPGTRLALQVVVGAIVYWGVRTYWLTTRERRVVAGLPLGRVLVGRRT